jgi:arylsulfatase A-like enzyme
MRNDGITRRGFTAALAAAPGLLKAQSARPNIILMMTDDQGFGDLSIHGNPVLKTPNIDSLGRDGVRFSQFHVNPVCSPTRSSLMTGRYYYRTGVVDTFLGRSMMHSDEVTVAECLSEAGYRTGLFGKWHLGDNYPLRSIDQGFQESLNCTGGGLTQPSDPPGNTYFDPMLRHNGKWEKHKGYCTDIFFRGAMEFIEANRSRPFFLYLPTNAPHDPLQIDDSFVDPYRKAGVEERTAKVYGMVKNVDDNVGRLLAKLKQLRLEENTIVIFLTDNGPQHDRYNAGMRGRKATVYEGGIRVPFLMRWPRGLKRGATVNDFAAHIDVMPTLLEACAVAPPKTQIDGRSLMPLLNGKAKALPRRTTFFQWHRGEAPNPHQNACATDGRYKLVNGKELYDLSTDPGEKSDIAAAQPEIARKLRGEYDRWFADVAATRRFAPPKIFLGTEHEDPVTLTRQDWRGPNAAWSPQANGHWEVDVRKAGRYEITLRFLQPVTGEVRFRLGGSSASQQISGAKEAVIQNVELAAGPGQLQGEVANAAATVGANYVDVRRA